MDILTLAARPSSSVASPLPLLLAPVPNQEIAAAVAVDKHNLLEPPQMRCTLGRHSLHIQLRYTPDLHNNIAVAAAAAVAGRTAVHSQARSSVAYTCVHIAAAHRALRLQLAVVGRSMRWCRQVQLSTGVGGADSAVVAAAVSTPFSQGTTWTYCSNC